MNHTKIDVQALSGVDIRSVSKDALTDVSGLTLDTNVPHELRPAKVLLSTGNPYCFRVGELAVKLEFMDNAPPLQEVFCSFLQRKKSGL